MRWRSDSKTLTIIIFHINISFFPVFFKRPEEQCSHCICALGRNLFWKKNVFSKRSDLYVVYFENYIKYFASIISKQNSVSFSTNMNIRLFNANLSFIFEVMTQFPQPTANNTVFVLKDIDFIEIRCIPF